MELMKMMQVSMQIALKNHISMVSKFLVLINKAIATTLQMFLLTQPSLNLTILLLSLSKISHTDAPKCIAKMNLRTFAATLALLTPSKISKSLKI